MAIKWYKPEAKPSAHVKLTNDNVTFTESGLARLREIDSKFETTEHVRLGWDSDMSAVAIVPADAAGADTFKFGRRGRSLTSRTVNAGKLFSSCGVTSGNASLADGSLAAQSGVATFRLAINSASPKRRGRRPKSSPA